MDLASLIPLAIKTSIFLTVFALGLNATLEDALYLLRRPSQLIRSLVSMQVIMPIVAVALVLAFNFHPAMKIALLTLAVSPIPPFLPKKGFKVGGHSPYVIGLLVAVSVLSIIIVPIAVDLEGRVFGRAAHMSPAGVAQLMLRTVLLPLAAGIAVRHFAPAFAEKIEKPVALIATILLAAAIPILFVAWPAITSLIGNGAIIAIAVFVIIGLAVGHLLGGPDPDDRSRFDLK
jgi:bile acid:Na+ symporter, BASS family